MSLLDTFDAASEPVLRAGLLHAPVPQMPRTLVVTFKDEIRAMAAGLPGAEPVADLNPAFQPAPVYRIPWNGTELGLYQTVVGGAGSAMLLENACAMGAERFIFFGSCGVLNPAIDQNRILVPTAAWRDEGVSYHYAPASDWLEVRSAGRMQAALDALGVPHQAVRSWTTDALYRETTGNCARRRAAGCDVAEMECASVMACASWLGRECLQFLYVDDALLDEEWDAGKWFSDEGHRLRGYLQIALEAAAWLQTHT